MAEWSSLPPLWLQRLLYPDPKGRFPGSRYALGVYKCKGCKKQYTVRIGTIFEDSHIPFSKWIMAMRVCDLAARKALARFS